MSRQSPRISAFVCVPAAVALFGGCSAKWEAQPVESQLVFVDGEGLEQQADGLSVRVTSVAVPESEQDDLIAFGVEIGNDRPAAVAVGLWRFRLQMDDGLLRRPLSTSELVVRFGLDQPDDLLDEQASSPLTVDAGAAVSFASYPGPPGPRRNRRHWYYRRYRSRWYPDPYAYRNIYWNYPYYYPYDLYWNRPYPYTDDGMYTIEQERRELSRLVSEVWEDDTLSPREAGGGVVVFNVPSAKDSDVKLLFDATDRAAPPVDAAFPDSAWSFQFLRTQ